MDEEEEKEEVDMKTCKLRAFPIMDDGKGRGGSEAWLPMAVQCQGKPKVLMRKTLFNK